MLCGHCLQFAPYLNVAADVISEGAERQRHTPQGSRCRQAPVAAPPDTHKETAAAAGTDIAVQQSR